MTLSDALSGLSLQSLQTNVCWCDGSNAFFKFRDEAFARGVFDIKQITKDYKRDKSDAATAARDKQDAADDREFAEKELAEESAEKNRARPRGDRESWQNP